MSLGKLIRQPEGYQAFIPDSFPAASLLEFPQPILFRAALAERLIGKLDGITLSWMVMVEQEGYCGIFATSL